MAKYVAKTSASPAPTHEENIAMLFDKLKELKMSSEDQTESRIFGRVERRYSIIFLRKRMKYLINIVHILELLRNEIDKVQITRYFGIECDSDEELNEEESDGEYFSDDEPVKSTIHYDLDTMFEIVKKRDFNKWSIRSIHHRYRQIKEGATGRKQIARYIWL